MEFSEYLRMVAKRYSKETSWRMGQAYFNVLHEINPHLAHGLRGSHCDPFFNDVLIPTFLLQVSLIWEDFQEDFTCN